MKRFLLPILVSTLIITACGDRSVGNARVNAPASVTPVVVPQKSTTPNLSPIANPAQTAATPITATANLNPAHGQPGHRCDIAVGAPLDSKPVNNTAPGVQQALPPAINTAPATVAAGLNPAHGQPNHRCDIPVGAPLDSKPAGK